MKERKYDMTKNGKKEDKKERRKIEERKQEGSRKEEGRKKKGKLKEEVRKKEGRRKKERRKKKEKRKEEENKKEGRRKEEEKRKEGIGKRYKVTKNDTYPLRTPRTRLSIKNDPTIINKMNALQLIIGKQLSLESMLCNHNEKQYRIVTKAWISSPN